MARSEIGDQPRDVREDQPCAVAGGTDPTGSVQLDQSTRVGSAPIPGDGAGQSDHVEDAASGPRHRVDLADTIGEIREQWRRRQAWHRAEKSLTLQAKALCRRLAGGDKAEADRIFAAAYGTGSHPLADIGMAATFPLIQARDAITLHRVAVERRLAKLAKALPVAPWVEGIRGVGIPSLAALVGEAGDLSAYPTVAKLWKRLGLAVMPDGTRQRRVGGNEGVEHGYNPARRAVVWNVGASILKTGGPYRAVYDQRKVLELTRVETKGHAHNRAQRYAEKKFVRDLWVAWRRTGNGHQIPADLTRTAAPST